MIDCSTSVVNTFNGNGLCCILYSCKTNNIHVCISCRNSDVSPHGEPAGGQLPRDDEATLRCERYAVFVLETN